MYKLSDIPLSTWPGNSNVQIVRGDLIHPVVSGNKLYKLLPGLKSISANQQKTIISVGGRYSNHLHALAWVGQQQGIETIGLVRGFVDQPLTPTLKDCLQWGMSLHFVDYQTYQQRYTSNFWQPWLKRYPHAFIVKEGGWSSDAIDGSSLWWEAIPDGTNIVICSIGSGATLAGLLLGAPNQVEVIGVPVFKDPDSYWNLKEKIRQELGCEIDPHLWTGYAGRGFGKLSEEQKAFKEWFENNTDIQLDPVYTTKTFHALDCELKKNKKLGDQRIAVLHSGGLQGNRSV